jgi:hypothetical protein
MSEADKRQTRQRTLTIGACAAVFAFGGPLVAQRFGDQKAQEAYLNEAAVLAESIKADAHDALPTLRPGMFSNRAQPVSLEQASATAEPLFAPDSEFGGMGSLSIRQRDSEVLKGLVTFTLDDLGPFQGVDKQLDCLSRAVYYESRSEDLVGQVAVAEVVMNRVHDPRFPKSICGVVYQGQYRETGCQFTFTCDGSVRVKPSGDAWDRAKAVALHVMLGLNKAVTNGATHYHTDYVNPYWAPGLVETAEIGQHIFYRFPETSKEWSRARAALAARRERDSIDVLDAAADAETLAPTLDGIPAEAVQSLITVAVDSPDDVAPVVTAKAAIQTEGQPL